MFIPLLLRADMRITPFFHLLRQCLFNQKRCVHPQQPWSAPQLRHLYALRGLLTPPAICQSEPALFPPTVHCDTALSSVKALTAVNIVTGLRHFRCLSCGLMSLPVEYPLAARSLLPPVWPRSLLLFAIASVFAEAC